MPRSAKTPELRPDLPGARIAAVRRFNRFYTATIGALGDAHLSSRFSLTETRVLYELAHREGLVAADLVRELRLDGGYVSRLLARLVKRGLVSRRRVGDDRRRATLTLTRSGATAFRALDRAASQAVEALLLPVAEPVQRRLVAALEEVQADLAGATDSADALISLRPPRPGELGWVIERHGVIYAREYAWDLTFEALVARIVADFAQTHDPRRERCWIAERRGVPVGSVFLVAKSPEVAQLRLLLVEPSARGLGIGQLLVTECIRFARAAGYARISLWTNDVLVSARRIYEGAGFGLVHEAPHHSFGHDLVEQVWERAL
jgi:DNA-binding MarR family transcriptional regulator/GNAT superfamily N-acetyltransferase